MPDPHRLTADVRSVGLRAGLDALAVCSAEPFAEARRAIDDRKARGLHAGMFFTYGNPDRSADPGRIVAGARSIVVGLRSYARPARPSDDERVTGPVGTVARYVHNDEYGALATSLEAVATFLRSTGAEAEVVLDQNRLIDRAAAYRAGLGWLGHNTMLLNERLGSWTVIGSVVTDAELEHNPGPADDGCGSCSRCQVECPTGALDEAGVLDANKCLAWLVQAAGVFPVEFRNALGDRIYGCDDCQEVCPVNDAAGSGSALSVVPEREPRVDVLDLLAADDDTLMDRYGHWYVPRRRPEYLRRNALLVLANGGRVDDRTRTTLRAALAHEHEIVRAHAVWAAKRLGADDLLDAVADDPAAEVRDELARTVKP